MIQVQDLIDREHEPLRCLGYVRIALKRYFADFDPAELPSTPEEARAWLRSPPVSAWREIGTNVYAATKDGDVVYGEERGDGAYVAVLVDPKGGGFLTSSAGRGSYIRLRRTLKGVVSVQRRDR